MDILNRAFLNDTRPVDLKINLTFDTKDFFRNSGLPREILMNFAIGIGTLYSTNNPTLHVQTTTNYPNGILYPFPFGLAERVFHQHEDLSQIQNLFRMKVLGNRLYWK